jgi:hypothetical protein
MTNETINPENGKQDENKNRIYGLRFLHAEFASSYQLLRMTELSFQNFDSGAPQPT